MKKTLIALVCICFCTCKNDDDFTMLGEGSVGVQATDCNNLSFPNWASSGYVLPYPVGKSYPIGLNACSSSYHAPGQPDQFAIDFNMTIGKEVTASTDGLVVFVEESGNDYEYPNNKVVVLYGDVYVQYMHLTKNGAVVETGTSVSRGDLIGYSGATGAAGYPHLHFVVTTADGWQYPYDSSPVAFRNTEANPSGLQSGQSYLAEPY